MTTEQLFRSIQDTRKPKEQSILAFPMHSLQSNTVTNEYYPTLAKTLFEVAVKLRRRPALTLSSSICQVVLEIPYKPGSGVK